MYDIIAHCYNLLQYIVMTNIVTWVAIHVETERYRAYICCTLLMLSTSLNITDHAKKEIHVYTAWKGKQSMAFYRSHVSAL